VDQEQRRLTSRLHRSIRTQVRCNEATRPKAQSAPLRSNSNSHVTGNNIYVPENTGHQRKTYFRDQLEIKEISALERTQMAAIDRLKNQHSGTDNMGNLSNLRQQQAHSSQPEARRNTLDPRNINPSVFSSTRRDRTSGFGTGFGSACKTGQTD
jgi:hypothetical protein